MVDEEDSTPAKSGSSSVTGISTSETTPLLANKPRFSKQPKRIWPEFLLIKVLITAFMCSLSFGVTQVPLIYVFGVMTCDEYYKTHKLPPLGTPAYEDRCRIHSIDASTARSVAILGTLTTVSGVANLFVTNWIVKGFGVKAALLVAVFWPAVRLLIQNIGVMIGAAWGIIIIQASQLTTVVGGPAGYLLALNSFATEIVLPSERTATLGRLQGSAMFGTALGFLVGGLLSDWFGIATPFRVTLVLFCISTLYTFLALPTIPLNKEVEKKVNRSLVAFFEPLKMFAPRKWVLHNGTVQREYGVLFLGIGVFLAVLATGYIPTLLQMYSTDVFGFTSSDNSELISLNFVIRAMYLTFAFPVIISKGRTWYKERNKKRKALKDDKIEADIDDDIPAIPAQLASAARPAGEETAAEPDEPLIRTKSSESQKDVEDETFEFDLLYTRYSLILDGVLTSLAAFTTHGWQMFVVAFVIPLAAGTGSAAKGTMLQMCTPEEKTDALSAISLLELIAKLSTISIFGLIFSGFAELGLPHLVFGVNGAVAVVGFVVLLLVKFPPFGAVRYERKDHEDETGAGD